MDIVLSPVMTHPEIIQYINENPNLSVTQLQDLAGRVDVSDAAGDKVSVLYTGRVDADSANSIAKGIVNQHNTSLGIIDVTDAKDLFEDFIFTNALEDAIKADNPTLPQNQIDILVNNELFKTDGGMWSIASENLASQASGDVMVILSPEADSSRIFGEIELPKLLNNTAVSTINSIDRLDLKDIFDNQGIDAAMNNVEIIGGGYLTTIEQGLDSGGNVVYKTDKLSEGFNGFSGDDFPVGTTGKTSFASLFDTGSYSGWWSDVLNAYQDNPAIKQGFAKAGLAGDIAEFAIISSIVAVSFFNAGTAYANGDNNAGNLLVQEGVDVLVDWVLDTTEGAIGAAIAVSALLGLVAVIGVAIPAGIVGGAIILAVGIAGAVIGEALLDLREIAKLMGDVADDPRVVDYVLNGQNEILEINDIFLDGLHIYGDSGITDIFDTLPNLVQGANNIIGTDEDDLVLGGLNGETLDGGDGDDTIIGDAGNDLIVGSEGDDIIDGGADIDTVNYSAINTFFNYDVTVNLATNSAFLDFVGPNNNQTLYNIENVVTGSGDDDITGNAQDNILAGGTGDDKYRFTANSGVDTIIDSTGDDEIIVDGVVFNGSAVEDTNNAGQFNLSVGGIDAVITWGGDPSNSVMRGDLRIDWDGNSGDDIIIKDFANGEFGIVLDGVPVEPDDGVNTADGAGNPLPTIPPLTAPRLLSIDSLVTCHVACNIFPTEAFRSPTLTILSLNALFTCLLPVTEGRPSMVTIRLVSIFLFYFVTFFKFFDISRVHCVNQTNEAFDIFNIKKLYVGFKFRKRNTPHTKTSWSA